MAEKTKEPDAWLLREDIDCRADRIARLKWLASVLPSGEYLAFPGGLMPKLLFEEMRYCFAYGQFLATIVLGMSYIEWTLAAKFFAAGRTDLERASLSSLLREAGDFGVLTRKQADKLDRIRRVRNPVAHFRKPLADDSIEIRSIRQNNHWYQVLERDARFVVDAVMQTLRQGSI